ncbi:MAG: transcriptional regulator [Proteobacteria bacterium]|nr:MAG: transcriptional regulator [Pseudomonadota bacterium]
MYTIFETIPFTQIRCNYWNDEEYGDFCRFLAENPEAGEVVTKSGGVRKVRWALPGTGKSGGVRVIYYCRLEYGQIWLMTLYSKSKTANLPPHVLKNLKEYLEDTLENGYE